MATIEVLTGLLGSIASGGIKVVDLTETLPPEYPTITLQPEFGQASPMGARNVSASGILKTALLLSSCWLAPATSIRISRRKDCLGLLHLTTEQGHGPPWPYFAE